nr:MauE/DoxX family redox-associated membrane protein [uncultured Amphritea sp.]
MNSQASIPETLQKPLSRSLLALRLGVFVVMLVWTLDKFANPAHTGVMMNKFYGIDWLTQYFAYIIGAAELLFILAFVAGLWRRWTYMGILVLHTLSTLVAYNKYMDPFNNLLFFAAWPMLAACLALYWLRDWDTLCTIPQKQKSSKN